MGTYGLPRNVKGEGKILFVFSTKALIYTSIGAAIGFVFYYILNLFGFQMIGIFIMALLGFIGFCIATFKMPNTNAFKITEKTGGENIDEVIKRAIMFKRKKNKVYVCKEVKKDE